MISFLDSVVFCTTFSASFLVLKVVDNRLLKQALFKRMKNTPLGQGSGHRPDQAVYHGFIKALGKLAVPKEEKEISKIRKQLIHAGYRHKDAVILFYGIRIGAGLGLAVLGLVLAVGSSGLSAWCLIMFFFPLAAGYVAGAMVLKQKIAFRENRIFKELPDTLDLLTICLKAGLGFDYALYRVCQELEETAPVLSAEFGIYFLEVKSGILRTQALENIARRNPSPFLKNVVTVLIQSFSTGTDIASALNIYTAALRDQRRQDAEEEGAKLPTKLTLPLVVFILPALLIIILGPVVINFISMMKGGL